MIWSYEGESIRIPLAEWLVTKRDERALEDWRARGWLNEQALSVPLRDWLDAGQPPRRSDDDTVRLESWSADHDRLARLVGLTNQVVRIRSVGHLLARGLKFEVALNAGDPFEVAESPAVYLRAQRPLAPATGRALELIQSVVNAAGEARYREWYQLQTLNDRLAVLPDPFVRLEFDEHLRSFAVDAAERISIGWTSEGDSNQVVTLQLHAVLPDGRHEPIDLGHVDPSGQVSTATAKRPVVLPPGAAQLVPLAKARKREPRMRREAELSNPALVVPEGVDVDDFIDLSEYADRVAGFEVAKPSERPRTQDGSGIEWFAAPDPEFFLSLQARRPTGATETIRLATREDAERFVENARNSVQGGRSGFNHAGREFSDADKALAAVEPLLRSTAERREETEPPPTGAKGERWAAVLHPLHADGQVDDDGLQVDEKNVPWPQLKSLLRAGVELKEHQRRGLAWLWGHLSNGIRGVLLADDMGLGKTLQVAALLALARTGEGTQSKPHLVVCPSVLLDNWSRELSRFFAPTTFAPTLVLHSDTLRAHRLKSGLDVKRIAENAVVITNYETLASHQLSLLKIDWDVAVFDEAQWIKNETTLRSRGAAGLKRRFGVAMTGTPVENRLSDVWAIFDALEHEPPRTFGTKPEFVAQYERSGGSGVDSVRAALAFPSAGSRLLRREKAQALRDLPPKVFHELPTPMSEQQFSHERTLLSQRNGRSALQLIQQLQFLYQHPLLLSNKDPWSYTVAELADMSPKLERTCRELERIRGLGERAIVFTQFKRMQDILVRVLRERFALTTVPVINGDESNREAAQRNIDWFMGLTDFGVMVLSPLAAGIGLTITAANHVIHYGRWWNPAKEEQATDRAHRIGQTRVVHVYYPTLHHPADARLGFDRKLHELVERKRAVARDFLRPADELELNASDVDAVGGSPGTA